MNKDLLMDKRIVHRNIRRGLVRKEDYESHLTSLQDGSSNMEYVSIDAKGEEGAAAVTSSGSMLSKGSPSISGEVPGTDRQGAVQSEEPQ